MVLLTRLSYQARYPLSSLMKVQTGVYKVVPQGAGFK